MRERLFKSGSEHLSTNLFVCTNSLDATQELRVLLSLRARRLCAKCAPDAQKCTNRVRFFKTAHQYANPPTPENKIPITREICHPHRKPCTVLHKNAQTSSYFSPNGIPYTLAKPQKNRHISKIGFDLQKTRTSLASCARGNTAKRQIPQLPQSVAGPRRPGPRRGKFLFTPVIESDVQL